MFETSVNKSNIVLLFFNQVQEARGQHDDEAVKRAINEYEDALGRYIPVLMAQAKIYWELDMYQQVKSFYLCK